ncbi:hypothetical protein ACI1US_00095 [Leucobacter sp. BZR 635]|uniref:hypothetical protein n=1 Tax=Leucobacter sp. BZR 635 TaxID=3378705 RepID=UPI003A888082
MSLGESTTETPAPKPLFEPSPTPRMPASEIFLIILAMVLVFGGFYMMGLAFSVPEWAFWLFGGGIIVDAIGFWVAFGIIPSREK